jgi:hypothetical protein
MTGISGAVTPAKVNAAQAADDARLDSLEAGPILPTYTVAALPAAASNTGRIVRCSNGNAGAACLAVSNGTSWLRVVFGTAVAVT